MKRIFIEDIGVLREQKEEVKVWVITNSQDDGLPSKIYLVESPAGEQLILGRGIWGRKKFELIQRIAKVLFGAMLEEMVSFKDPRQFIILRGGYPFDLQNVSKELLPDRILPTTFTKLQRVLVDNRWVVKEMFSLGGYEGDLWLIPDTAIASGSTISYLLNKALRSSKPKKIIIFTAAGSIEGVTRIWRVCQQHKVEMIPVFSQCIFQVSKDGVLPNLPYTDLPVENPKTITSKSFYEKAHQIYQGKPMCCVGDVGDSLENPEKYIEETLKEIKILKIDTSKPGWEWTKSLQD